MSEFPVLERFAYLNAGTLGPLSRATLSAIEARTRLDQELGRGGRRWFDGILELRGRVREGVAATIGAPANRVALASSTTDGCNIVLAGLPLETGDEVVTTDAEHPGLLLPLHATGARVRVAEVAAQPTSEALERILAAVTPRTRLLALSHVLWTTGQVMPVHELKAETGLPVLVDGAQSVGAIAVEVGELDFYTVSGQKWLCGPESTGGLYVRDPELLRVARPTYLSQQALEKDGSFVPKDGALRFDSGWTATAALAGFEAALASAPEDRFERAARATAACREALLAAGATLISEAEQGTLVSFLPLREDSAPADEAVRLYEQGVIVRDLPGTPWLRASCGWWTTQEHVDRLVAALAA